MSMNNESKFTVQRLDTVVPVGSGVPRTGLARPSAIDCSVPLVVDQAGTQVPITGSEALLTPQRAKGETQPQLRLTPERKEDMNVATLGMSLWIPPALITGAMGDRDTPVVDPTNPEENKDRKKKKEVNTSTKREQGQRGTERKATGTSNPWSNLAKIIKKAKDETKKLAAIVSANQNTRRDIKVSMAVIIHLMAQMTTSEMLDLVAGQEVKRQDDEHKAESRETGCQTNNSEIKQREKIA